MTGALDDGSENAPVAAELAKHFTVINYNRRGRGASGDTLPHAVEREIEDLDALIAEAGGWAHVYGVSSGGMFAIEAAAAGSALDKLALYEVPYDVADDAPPRYGEYREQLGTALAEGRRGRRSSSSCGWPVPPRWTSRAPGTRFWLGLERLAHTLAYDAACYGQPPTARLARISSRPLWSPAAAQASSSRRRMRSPRASLRRSV